MNLLSLAGPILTALLAISGWIFSISNETSLNTQRIEALESKTDRSFEKLQQSLKNLEQNQRKDMQEIRKELRYLNSRIDTVIEKKG